MKKKNHTWHLNAQEVDFFFAVLDVRKKRKHLTMCAVFFPTRKKIVFFKIKTPHLNFSKKIINLIITLRQNGF